MTSKHLLVSLVARQSIWYENLAVGYLRSALTSEGFAVQSIGVNDFKDIYRAAEHILKTNSRLVAISMTDAPSAVFLLGLGELLVKKGFKGHITCGGQFVTLARKWMLDRYSWIDSVVRFRGEGPLVELASRLEQRRPVFGVPGLTTRQGDGAFADVLNCRDVGLRPYRGELSQRLGYDTAMMIASKGCNGTCAYCGPYALSQLEREEAEGQGADEAMITEAGIGRVRRRDVEDLCDEMASLWHDRNVRYFGFVDEHLIPFAENEALSFLAKWRKGLKDRGVGTFSVGGQLRASQVTPRIAQSLKELGVIRLHLGMDLGIEGDESSFQRPAALKKERDAAFLLNTQGITTLSNLMLIHPYSTVRTIEDCINAMSDLSSGVVETTQMFVYEGTSLQRRLADEGRLVGNPLRWDYEALSPEVQRFTSLYLRLRKDAFGICSIGLTLHESLWNLLLLKKMSPRLDISPLAGELGRIREYVHRIYVDAYRRALDICANQLGDDHRDSLISEISNRRRFVDMQLCRIEEQFAQLLDLKPQPSAARQMMAASVLSMCMITAAGCRSIGTHDKSDTSFHSTDDTSSEIDAGLGTDTDKDTASADGDTDTDTDSDADTDSDTDADTDADTDTDTDADTDTDVDADTENCDEPGDYEYRRHAIESALKEELPCFNGYVNVKIVDGEMSPFSDLNIDIQLQSTGQSVNLSGSGADALTLEAENIATRVATDLGFTCLDNDGAIDGGGAQTETQDLISSAFSACQNAESFFGEMGEMDLYLILNDKGFVQEVAAYNDEAETIETAACINQALAGISFPCLSDMEVHFYYMVVLI
jgi:radical SAM superfamily enzyme YgiQ (UPF0313 family)